MNSTRGCCSPLFVALILVAQLAIAQPASPLIPQYPNTEPGLEQLMGDMLALQKKGDATALSPYLDSLVVPNADRWFTSEFGDARCAEKELGPNDCLGPRMALAYLPLAKVLPASFSLTLSDLLHEGMTNFEATNYMQECPGPIRIAAARELIGGLTTTPYLSASLSGLAQHHEPIYVVWAYSETKETTLPFFVYSEGAFRYLGMLHPASDVALRRDAAGVNSETEPAAHYLTEDQLEMSTHPKDPDLVRKVVVLRVLIDLDGKAKEVTYVRGPEAEKKNAIKRARKRRYDVPPVARAIHAKSFPLCVSE
jgi:hypothetical protein